MIIHNKRHRADLTCFYQTMMNDPDLYLSLCQQASGQSNDYVPTREELGNELTQYRVFKMWMKNRKLNKNKEMAR